jgi:thioesterase-3
VYTTNIKVRGYHLDMYGHVNNARYLEFLEEARWALMEEQPAVAGLHARGLSFVVVNINIDYRRPATNGDELTIASRLAHVGNRSMAFEQVVTLAGTDEVVAQARVTFVLVDSASGRPVVIDDELRTALGIPLGVTGDLP